MVLFTPRGSNPIIEYFTPRTFCTVFPVCKANATPEAPGPPGLRMIGPPQEGLDSGITEGSLTMAMCACMGLNWSR